MGLTGFMLLCSHPLVCEFESVILDLINFASSSSSPTDTTASVAREGVQSLKLKDHHGNTVLHHLAAHFYEINPQIIEQIVTVAKEIVKERNERNELAIKLDHALLYLHEQKLSLEVIKEIIQADLEAVKRAESEEDPIPLHQIFLYSLETRQKEMETEEKRGTAGGGKVSSAVSEEMDYWLSLISLLASAYSSALPSSYS